MVISDKAFTRLGKFIQDEFGIKMPSAKRVMLQTRLQKRLRALNMQSFEEYCDHLFSEEGMQTELVHMIDLVSTNKTDFFREPKHFDFLTEKILPRLLKNRSGGKRRLLVWSAGCSSGEEPYTLAMVLSEYAECNPELEFSVLATDISTRMLEMAQTAIYPAQIIAPIPEPLKRKYLLRSKDKNPMRYRIVPELRSLVQFRRLNFMDKNFGINKPVDIIFCRNVIIYFDKKTQEILLNKLAGHLSEEGYLFLGHSETLHGIETPFLQIAPTVYRKSS